MLNQKEIKQLVNNVYWTSPGIRRHGVDDELFIEQHQCRVDPTIGARFNGHGIAKGSIEDQVSALNTILENGIDEQKGFYTAPYEVQNGLRAALGSALGTGGGTCYKDGFFVLLSYPDEMIKNTKDIAVVLVNRPLYNDINVLKQAFPKVSFIKMCDAGREMKNMCLQKDAAQMVAENEIYFDRTSGEIWLKAHQEGSMMAYECAKKVFQGRQFNVVQKDGKKYFTIKPTQEEGKLIEKAYKDSKVSIASRIGRNVGRKGI